MKHIIQGIANHVFEGATEESIRKMKICSTCEFIKDKENTLFGPKCGKCGCTLKYKTKSDSTCPIQKW